MLAALLFQMARSAVEFRLSYFGVFCRLLEAMLGAWRPKPDILTFISRALRPFWGCLRAILGHPGAILRNLGRSWGHFGPSCGYLEQSDAVLGPSWSHHGAFRGHLGGYLGPSEAVLGPSEGRFGAI